MDMNVVFKMLSFDEGNRQIVYPDSENIPTVGIGHNLRASPALGILKKHLVIGNKISKQQVVDLFQADVATVIAGLEKHVPDFAKLKVNYQYLLVNMCFQLGLDGLLEFKHLLQALKEDNTVAATSSIEASAYYREVPNRANRMITLLTTIPKEYLPSQH